MTQAASEGATASEKLRRVFKTITVVSCELFFTDRKIYDIAVHSCSEHWPSADRYVAQVGALLGEIIVEGRASGEFERKTPIDELVRAIVMVLQPFMNPLMLQYNFDGAAEGANEAASLVLRSLAP